MNKVILLGRLTRDPELSFLANQTPVAGFGLAVNRKYKDKEEVMFIDCTAFGKTAEIMSEHLTKGRQALIEGRLTLDQWTSKDGQKCSRHKVVVDRFDFIGGREDQAPRQAAAPKQTVAQPPDTYDDKPQEDFGQTEEGHDIPF